MTRHLLREQEILESRPSREYDYAKVLLAEIVIASLFHIPQS